LDWRLSPNDAIATFQSSASTARSGSVSTAPAGITKYAMTVGRETVTCAESLALVRGESRLQPGTPTGAPTATPCDQYRITVRRRPMQLQRETPSATARTNELD